MLVLFIRLWMKLPLGDLVNHYLDLVQKNNLGPIRQHLEWIKLARLTPNLIDAKQLEHLAQQFQEWSLCLTLVQTKHFVAASGVCIAARFLHRPVQQGVTAEQELPCTLSNSNVEAGIPSDVAVLLKPHFNLETFKHSLTNDTCVQSHPPTARPTANCHGDFLSFHSFAPSNRKASKNNKKRKE